MYRLTAFRQLQILLHKYPDSIGRMTHHSAMFWQSSFQPTEISQKYDVAIEYSDSIAQPLVYVKTPLKLYPGEKKLPHVFSTVEQRICLNVKNEWNKSLTISSHYVPWACEWLYYYETWVVTGEWLGGGLHNGILTT